VSALVNGLLRHLRQLRHNHDLDLIVFLPWVGAAAASSILYCLYCCCCCGEDTLGCLCAVEMSADTSPYGLFVVCQRAAEMSAGAHCHGDQGRSFGAETLRESSVLPQQEDDRAAAGQDGGQVCPREEWATDDGRYMVEDVAAVGVDVEATREATLPKLVDGDCLLKIDQDLIVILMYCCNFVFFHFFMRLVKETVQ
jgi:hypothetical protein